ncbi:hypothetical protein ACHAXS_007691 [Conticribra weissflogii]
MVHPGRGGGNSSSTIACGNDVDGRMAIIISISNASHTGILRSMFIHQMAQTTQDCVGIVVIRSSHLIGMRMLCHSVPNVRSEVRSSQAKGLVASSSSTFDAIATTLMMTMTAVIHGTHGLTSSHGRSRCSSSI